LSLANSNRDLVVAYEPIHPVPEPGTIVLLACGGLVALAIRRRFRVGE
jgi:hypothetical protein